LLSNDLFRYAVARLDRVDRYSRPRWWATPASIYAAAPSNAPAPEAIPIAIGLVQQASNLGQFAGPTALGWFIDQFGWSAAPVMTVPVAVFGLATATLVRDGSGRSGQAQD
jgi:predicted MFS family arabinose efflux permease